MSFKLKIKKLLTDLIVIDYNSTTQERFRVY